MVSIKKTLLHGMLVAALAWVPFALFADGESQRPLTDGPEQTLAPPQPADEGIPSIQNANLHFSVGGGYGYYGYRPYYYYYPYRPYYYSYYYYPYRPYYSPYSYYYSW